MNTIHTSMPFTAQEFQKLAQKATKAHQEIQQRLDQESPEQKFKREKYFKAYDEQLQAIFSRPSVLGRFMESKESFQLGDLKNAEVYLDLNDDSELRDSEKLRTDKLAKLDSNNDGILDDKDHYFKKLKIRFWDSQGEMHQAKLSDITEKISLSQFFKQGQAGEAHRKLKDHQEKFKREGNGGKQDFIANEAYYTLHQTKESQFIAKDIQGREFIYDSRNLHERLNPLANISSDVTFKRATLDVLQGFFDHANQDGWVNLEGTEALGINSRFLNLGYQKHDSLGNSRIQAFNSQKEGYEKQEQYKEWLHKQKGDTYESKLHGEFKEWLSAYTKATKENQESNAKLFKEIQGVKLQGIDSSSVLEFKSFTVRDLEEKFTQMTGMPFSEMHLAKAKESFHKNELAETFADKDTIVAIKQDTRGGFLLKFDTGRILKVDELFYQDEKTLQQEAKNHFDLRGLALALEGKSLKEYKA